MKAICGKHGINELSYILPGAFSSMSDTLIDLSDFNIRTLLSESFRGCKAKHVVLPASVKEISAKAFDDSSITTIEFMSSEPPLIIGDDGKIENVTMIVPDGCFMNYRYDKWSYLHVKEKNCIVEYEFTITEPGKLGDYLTYEIVNTIERLTLKGAIYDTDVEVLEKCKYLQYLNLSYCFVTKSPQTLKEEQAERDFQIALLKMLGKMAQEEAENQYEQGHFAEYVANGTWANYASKLAEQASNETYEVDKNCFCPSLSFDKLIEYHMPIQAEIVNLGDCPNLEKVTLPPKARVINYSAFSGCKNLKELMIPNSIEIIENGAFKDCVSLTSLDFSNTKLEKITERDTRYYDWVGTFEGCENLVEVRFPSTLTYINDGHVPDNCVFYFYSPEPPKGNYYLGNTIHIRKGTKSKWSDWLSKVPHVIDDL